MRIIFVFLISICFLGCIQHGEQENQPSSNLSVTANEKVTINYAEGFEVQYEENGVRIITKSLVGNAPFKDSLFLAKNKNITDLPDQQIIYDKIDGLACESSTHLAFLQSINGLNKVKALCGVQYVQSAAINQELKLSNTVELCNAGKLNYETLYGSGAEVFLAFPFGNQNSNKINKVGMFKLYIAEYLEQSQLARLEWIKLFGVLLGKEKEANDYFDAAAQRYLSLSDAVKKEGETFMLNLPFKSDWYMPAKKSSVVDLIEDAGLTYFYGKDQGTENVLHTKEEVWKDGAVIDYWIIMASRKPGYNLQDLLNEEPVYKTFKSVKNNQVIFCNTAEADYFAKGVTEPDVMLNDILYAMGELDHHTPVYFKLLK